MYEFSLCVIMREISFLMHSKRAIGLVLEISPVHFLSLARMIRCISRRHLGIVPKVMMLLNAAHIMLITASGSSLNNSKVIPEGPGALLLGEFSIAICISYVKIFVLTWVGSSVTMLFSTI
ncbi:hypothetical protein ROZALSC1DRAFT_31416 [Rozella allomycis CSF55]|uniref:Uncharacterized protein n=1 Tax=Rozella allomycis (strain CSF55) TaxID=988480 RepID=A0A4P9YEM0_ROZAC|nr:hypothetical protein ROZALSC1DRAFT_31416 [Rozella allomycis CSF55]